MFNCEEDCIGEIFNIVETKAKYQKVMLVYDDVADKQLIEHIYSKIKDVCVYNCKYYKDINQEELNNGYRVVVFIMSGTSFAEMDVDCNEFFSVFVLIDENILPFLVDDKNSIRDKEYYAIIKNNLIDHKIISSVYFNNFYNYLSSLIMLNQSKKEFCFEMQQITHNSLLEILNNLPKNYFFTDFQLIKELDINYENLQIVHLIIIDAFIVFLLKVSKGCLTLVDTYKIARNDPLLVDKIYAKFNNKATMEIINLNAEFLLQRAYDTKEKILNYFYKKEITNENVINIINKIKKHIKHDNNALFYLFLYEILENWIFLFILNNF